MYEVRSQQRAMRKLTPERQALALEAKNLREFGYTQQEIADAFGKPRRTVAYWLSIVANGRTSKVANYNHMARIPLTALATINITLYPCRYEESAQHIEPRSREATIELVDSKALVKLPTDLKEQIERQCQKILNLLK